MTTSKSTNGKAQPQDTPIDTEDAVQQQSTNLHTRKFEPIIPKTMKELQQFALNVLVARGVNHKDASAVAQMTYLLTYGMEIGLLPGEAAANLYITNGKVAMSAEFIRSRVFASGLVKEWSYHYDEKTGTATLRASRNDTHAAHELRLHTKDFAHLMKSQSVWNKYPKRMILARITTYMVRDLFPDVLHGFVSFEEAQEIDRHTGEPVGKGIETAINEEITLASELADELTDETKTT